MVTVTFVAGYGLASAVPADLKAAILLMVGHLYEKKGGSHPGHHARRGPPWLHRAHLPLPEALVMRAGRLDRQVTIQRDVGTTSDAYGHLIEDWQPLATVWAEVVPAGVAERLMGPERVGETTDTFRVRWLADVTPRDRLVADGRAYDIQGTQPEGRQRSLLITAVARADQ